MAGKRSQLVSAGSTRSFMEVRREVASQVAHTTIELDYDISLITASTGEYMTTINVRRLDEKVVDRLKLRASLNNRSLEGEVRHILERAVEDDMAVKRAAFLEATDRLLSLTEGRPHTPAEVLIREDRDSGHRDSF